MIALIVFIVCFMISYFTVYFIKLKRRMRKENEIYQRNRIKQFNHIMSITDMRA